MIDIQTHKENIGYKFIYAGFYFDNKACRSHLHYIVLSNSKINTGRESLGNILGSQFNRGFPLEFEEIEDFHESLLPIYFEDFFSAKVIYL